MRQLIFKIGMHAAVIFAAVTCGLDLISQPSSLAVIAGAAILFGVVVYYAPKLIDVAGTVDKWFVVVPLLLLCSFSAGCGASRIEPGHVGIKVHLYGGSKGVDFEPLGVGMVWYNPFSTSVYTYPTFVQTAKWTQSLNEGSSTNEELTFNTVEGMIVSADISLSYHLEGDKAPTFFGKFRSDNLATFTHGFMRNVARDAFNDLGPHYTVAQVYGEQKEALRLAVVERIQQQVGTFGIIIEQFGYLGALRLPPLVTESLNAKIQATQNALRVQNEVAQAEAEARKAVAVAKGAAEARLAIASAEATANKTIALSLTPELIQYMAVKQWDGKRPTVEGSGASLFLGLPAIGK